MNHARTLPEWANGLSSADTPQLAEDGSVEHNRGTSKEREEMSWDLRTETAGPSREYTEPSLRELQASHARQLSHYKTLLIRAQSASSSSLHDALSRLHDLDERYKRLEEEHARCGEKRAAREREIGIAGELGGGQDLAEAVKRLSKSEKVQMLGIMAEACDPSDIDSQIATLQHYKRTRFDILGRLEPKLAVKIMSNLLLGDIMNMRLVSRLHSAMTNDDDLWREMCHQRDPISTLSRDHAVNKWEEEYIRLVNRDRNWRLGLRVIVYPGHSDTVTCLKLSGQSLISGSSDGRIRIWYMSLIPSNEVLVPSAVLATGSVSCLDYLSSKGKLAAGFSDAGKIQLWCRNGVGWQTSHTLSGHSHGIKCISMNEEYLVSAGVDKVLIIWDHDSGEKVARFGQQPNISAGIHLAHDMVIAMTIDGVVRAFAIREKEMVKQFRVADLSKQDGLSLSDRKALQEMGSGAGGSCAIQWATGDGPIVTCATKSLVIRIRWSEILFTDKPTLPSRKPTDPSSLVGTPRKIRAATTPLPSPLTPRRHRLTSLKISTPPIPSPASTSSRVRPVGRFTPNRSNPPSANTISPSTSSRTKASSTAPTADTSVQSGTSQAYDQESQAKRLVPDISRLPQVLEVRRTPEVERGAFHPSSGRIVSSTRFAARAGSEKKIFISTGNEINVLAGAWTSGERGLETSDKRPTCLVVDGEKLVYGCSDGSIVVVGFS